MILPCRGLLNGTARAEPVAVPLGLGNGSSYDSQLSAVSMGINEACILLFNDSGEKMLLRTGHCPPHERPSYQCHC